MFAFVSVDPPREEQGIQLLFGLRPVQPPPGRHAEAGLLQAGGGLLGSLLALRLGVHRGLRGTSIRGLLFGLLRVASDAVGHLAADEGDDTLGAPEVLNGRPDDVKLLGGHADHPIQPRILAFLEHDAHGEAPLVLHDTCCKRLLEGVALPMFLLAIHLVDDVAQLHAVLLGPPVRRHLYDLEHIVFLVVCQLDVGQELLFVCVLDHAHGAGSLDSLLGHLDVKSTDRLREGVQHRRQEHVHEDEVEGNHEEDKTYQRENEIDFEKSVQVVLANHPIENGQQSLQRGLKAWDHVPEDGV
mmetsp:Transcript_89116/g.224183  ORF Transcript_89116/g.224183 Transcript_89116/m.224183 type:complete len:299 (-) Transcript_89116:198-1094(-)